MADSQSAAVQAEVIILCLPHDLVRVIFQIGGPDFVGVPQYLFRLPRGYAVLTDDPIQTGLSVGVDVNMQGILPVRQEPVGSPAHQDAGPLLRQFPDGDSQSQERLILQGLEKGTAAWLE